MSEFGDSGFYPLLNNTEKKMLGTGIALVTALAWSISSILLKLIAGIFICVGGVCLVMV